MANFNWLENLPWIVFGFVLTISVIIFLTGAFFFLFFRDPEKRQKGQRILIKSIYWFFSAILIIIVFFIFSWLLNTWQSTPPVENTGEIPFSPVSTNFPPSPKTIEVAGVYFNGPFWFGDNTFIANESVFLILCKNNDQYDIIYIGDIGGEFNLLAHDDYQCWIDNCQDYNKVYIALFWIPSESQQRHAIKTEALNSLNKAFKPPCPYE